MVGLSRDQGGRNWDLDDNDDGDDGDENDDGDDGDDNDVMTMMMVDGCQMTDNYQNNIVNDYSDGYSEDKPEIRKFCELVFHDSRAVPDLSSPVVVVPAFHVDQRPVGNLLPNICRFEASQYCSVCLKEMIIWRKYIKQIHKQFRTWNVKTLNAVGRDLFDLQCVGRGEQRMQGDPVWMRSPGSPSRDSTT